MYVSALEKVRYLQTRIPTAAGFHVQLSSYAELMWGWLPDLG